ncbi:MAG: 4Fe-4S binding protein [Gammaproteobacteria bacterium]|nr:4Fe-4S binding protein [Gammaproteobacteria bacterium]
MWVHSVMFVVFITFIFLPLALPEASENATALNNFTRFANFAMWGLWFPLVFLSVIFTGRSWCGLLCPMGAASEWANNKGLQRAIPKWLSWQGTPIVSFLVITILGQTVGVRDHPEAIAEIFGGTMLAAIVMGYIYGKKKRAWCRHACPIGLLLGVYSRLGIVQFMPKRLKPGGDRQTEKTLCPTMIDIQRKQESRHCIECFRCVQPRARGGLFVRLRRPGEEIEQISKHNANAYEVLFLLLGAGVALGGFLWLVLPQYQEFRQTLGVWFITNGWYWVGDVGPSWLMSVHPQRREVFYWLDFIAIVSFMISVMVLMTATLTSTSAVSAWVAGKLGGQRNFKQRWVELGYQYAPVAMVSLIIGLGGSLFVPIEQVSQILASGIKIGLFLASIIWSVWLGWRILMEQGLMGWKIYLPLLPSTLGSLLMAAAWWPSIS